jgi:putative heme-binding domain-containing protein
MAGGRGGRQGPDLSEVGAKRSPANLRQSLVEPEASIAGGFVLVNLTTRAGKKITGVRLNENTFSIQVRDLSDKIQSWRKSDLKEVKRELGKSTMPSYKSLSGPELDDLVAYLYSLRGGL